MPKLAKPLTDADCRGARRRSKPYKLNDGQNLYLHVLPTGSKTWRHKFKLRGRESVATGGTYPAVSLKDARAWRDANNELLAKGISPVLNRRVEKRLAEVAAANTFQAVAEAWINSQGEWTEERIKEVNTSLENDPFKAFGDRPIDEITRGDVLMCVEKIKARGSQFMARRVLKRIVDVFDHALAKGMIDDNPAVRLVKALGKPPKAEKHPRVESDTELGDVLRKVRGWTGHPTTTAALLVTAFTFVRSSELRLATWSEFDLDGKGPTWRIPASRMKVKDRPPHVVPLAPQVVKILREQHKVTKKARYVFESPLKPGKPISENTMNNALADMGYKRKQTAHGFRHIASTILHGNAWNPDWIETQLAHTIKGIRGVYNAAQYLDDRRRMMAWYAKHLDALAADEKSNVADIEDARRRRRA